MKKQLIAAAVAATMGSAFAGVAVTGSMDAVVTKGGLMTGTASPWFSKVKAKINFDATNGDSAFHATLLNDQTGAPTFNIDEMYATTTVFDGITMKAGNVKSRNGSGLTQKMGSAAPQYSISTEVAGFGVTATTANGFGGIDAATGMPIELRNSTSINVTGSTAGVDFTVQDMASDSRFITLATSVAGADVAVEYSDTVTAVSASMTVAGMGVTAASITAAAGDVTQDDGVFGNISGATDVTGVAVTTDTPFGGLKVVLADIDSVDRTAVSLSRGDVTYKYEQDGAADAILSARVKFKF